MKIAIKAVVLVAVCSFTIWCFHFTSSGQSQMNGIHDPNPIRFNQTQMERLQVINAASFDQDSQYAVNVNR